MGLGSAWRQYRVLIVMGASLGLIHWGWFQLKGHPALRRTQQREDDEYIPEPAIVSYVAPERQSGGK